MDPASRPEPDLLHPSPLPRFLCLHQWWQWSFAVTVLSCWLIFLSSVDGSKVFFPSLQITHNQWWLTCIWVHSSGLFQRFQLSGTLDTDAGGCQNLSCLQMENLTEFATFALVYKYVELSNSCKKWLINYVLPKAWETLKNYMLFGGILAYIQQILTHRTSFPQYDVKFGFPNGFKYFSNLILSLFQIYCAAFLYFYYFYCIDLFYLLQ